MILVLEESYEFSPPIDIKQVPATLIWPVTLYLTSQRRFHDIWQKEMLRMFDTNRQNFKFSQKILGICNFMVFAKHKRK